MSIEECIQNGHKLEILRIENCFYSEYFFSFSGVEKIKVPCYTCKVRFGLAFYFDIKLVCANYSLKGVLI